MQKTLCDPIIDRGIKNIVYNIENASSEKEIDHLLKQLVTEVRNNCHKSNILEKYREFSTRVYQNIDDVTQFYLYPMDSDGFAQAFDPVEDEEAYWDCWEKYGLVVGKALVSKEQCAKTIHRIKQLLQQLSNNQFDLDDPTTYSMIPTDENGIPCISRGFLEIYHDDSLAQLRQAVRIYLHHVLIWGRADLWTSFDRYGVKLPDNANAPGLPIHVDQNPIVHPCFKTTQGVLALMDCPIPQGTFVAVPGSRTAFVNYIESINAHDKNYRGEYVEAGWCQSLENLLRAHAQPIPLRTGDLVTWDSRTTHGNSPNLNQRSRIVAYISAGPAVESSNAMVAHRKNAYRSGVGQNVREALMHASKPPRCSLNESMSDVRELEKLNYLGKRLYGEESYSSSP